MRNKALMLAAAIAAVVLLAVLAAIAGGLYVNRAQLLDPPGMGARLGLYLRTNSAETSSDPVLPELKPLILAAEHESALRAVSKTALELGWQGVVVDEANAQLRAVIVSPLFRFRDDIQVHFLTHSADRTEAVVRSSSRLGRGDLGANVRHIMKLRDALRRRALLVEDDI